MGEAQEDHGNERVGVLWAEVGGHGQLRDGGGRVPEPATRWRTKAAVAQDGRAPAALPDGGGAKPVVGRPGTTRVSPTPEELLLRVQAWRTPTPPQGQPPGDKTGIGRKSADCLRAVAEDPSRKFLGQGMGGWPPPSGTGCDTRHGIIGARTGPARTGLSGRDGARKNPSALGRNSRGSSRGTQGNSEDVPGEEGAGAQACRSGPP